MAAHPNPILRWTALCAAAALLTGCSGTGAPSPSENAAKKRIEIVATGPHDPESFTQGLEIHDGVRYESTGGYGTSRVTTSGMEDDPAEPSARVNLPREQFGEGIALVPGADGAVEGGTLWQLTWTEGVAYARDPITLAERRRVNYSGEGWGLCHQAPDSGGPRLVMSNGSDELTFRDPGTFEPTGSVKVTRDGKPVRRLNELECVGDTVYANVFTTDEIVEIDPSSGAVRATIDAAAATAALPKRVSDDPDAVLNGIAAVPGTDRFWITGKRWPTTYEVRFVPA